MDYRKAWNEVKAMLERSLEEGEDRRFNEDPDTRESGMYEAYKRVLDHVKKLEAADPEAIKVGDTVRIANSDLCFDAYRDWIVRNVKNPFLSARWGRYRVPPRDATGLVRYIAPHGYQGHTLAYVEVGNVGYIMQIDGLEKI